MPETRLPPDRTWLRKFRDAFRGLGFALVGQSSLHVHVLAALAVGAVGAALRLNRLEWCLLAGCITLVFTAEMLNTAIERLAKAVKQEYDPHIRDALDVGSGAVLASVLGAAAIGAMVLWPHLWRIGSG